ncbi:MAG: hypothetical protein ACYDDS_17980 [Candidatus Sulfotelmatobacter sp.]
MPKSLLLIVCSLAICAPAAFAGVTVTSPANGATVSGAVSYAASATTSTCSKGVASMGIYTAPGVLAYVSNGTKLNTSLNLNAGTYNTTVEEWDYCGGAATTPIKITVTAGGGKSFTNLQHSGGWAGFGQRAPTYVDCSPSPCENVTFTMTQGVKSPAMSGESSAYYLAGSEAFGDTLWNNHLIGALSSQGIPDTGHTLVPSYHNFTYDVYFWVSNPGASQALEFDINQFFNSMGFIWGHECRIAGGNEWDVWDNLNQHWVPTGVSCYPNANAWNHLTLQVERTSSNELLYQSITLNGVTHTLNQYYNHGSAPSNWWGITINYQMDGNNVQTPYTAYLDELTFTYQ